MPSLYVRRVRSAVATVSLLMATLTLNSLAQNIGKEPDTVTIKQGQVLQMKLVKRLSSSRAHVGDDVLLKLRKPILVEGQTILPKGSPIHARITAVNRAGKNCKPGSIHWALEPLMMPGDAKIEIRFLDAGVAWSRVQAANESAKPVAEASKSQKPARKRGSSVGGVLVGIAAVPLIVAVLSIEILSEGEASCPGGKGREQSFWAGEEFYGEVNWDVQITVH